MSDNPMETVRDVGEVLRLVKEAAGLAKKLRVWFGSAPKGNDDVLGMRAVAVDLEERVMDLREQANELRDEVLRVREENVQLRSTADVAERIVYVHGKDHGVQVQSPRPGEPTGLCCCRCWEVDRALVSIQRGWCPQCHILGPKSS